MDHNNAYAILYEEKEFSGLKLHFFEKKEELEELITKLHFTKTKTNQPLSYFSNIFKKGSLYPTEYEQFKKERYNPIRKSYSVGSGYYVQRTLKNGKVKGKIYNFVEDFDWQISEWKEKGCKDIFILNIDESLGGDYYYDREIKKLWGNKEEPLLA